MRADRALLEMETQLRVLDDQHHLSSYFKVGNAPILGVLNLRSGKIENLSFREMTNKVIRGEYFTWELGDPSKPKIIVSSDKSEKWTSAEIDLISLMAFIYPGGSARSGSTARTT